MREISGSTSINLDAIRRNLDQLLKKVSGSDGIIISIGVFALILGVLVDIFLVRLVCLVLVIGSAGVMIALLRSRQAVGAPPPLTPTRPASGRNEYGHGVKKLFFDDYQPLDESDGFEVVIPRTRTVADRPAVTPVAETVRPAPAPVAQAEPQVRRREFQRSDFFDADASIYQADTEPRTEFNFLLQKILRLMKDVLFAHSVVFFWANREKQQMVMEARVSDSQGTMTSRRFPFGHDLISRVAETSAPEIIDEVNPDSERELLPYYSVPASVKSFAGVPVYYARPQQHSPGPPVGVLAIDSKAPDAFGDETLLLIGQFTKLISGLIRSSAEKYDLRTDAELLRAFGSIQDGLRKEFSMSTVLQQLAEESSRLVNWDHIAVILYDAERRAWVVKKVLNRTPDGPVNPDQPVDFPASLTGRVIRTGTSCIVGSLETTAEPRYSTRERPVKKGSFMAVPVSSPTKCYGAVTVEAVEISAHTSQDAETLRRLAECAAAALEVLFLQEYADEYVVIDETTGLFAKKFFQQRLEEELRRADDCSCDCTLLLISVDKAHDIGQRHGRTGYDRMMSSVAAVVRQNVRNYDLVGRYDQDRFGVTLLDTNVNDAAIWAEKIRKTVAASIITFEDKSFSVTVSVGLAGKTEGIGFADLAANAETVLRRASDTGGNCVRVY